jgi:hypothetical protein
MADGQVGHRRVPGERTSVLRSGTWAGCGKTFRDPGSWWTFLWATGLGILPLTILLSILGDRMLTMPLWAWALLGALALASWAVLHWRWRATG